MQAAHPRHQQGMALWVIFVAIALLAAIGGVFANSMRGQSASTARDIQMATASALLTQVANLKLGFDRMVTSGVPASSVTFSTTAGTGLFDPAAGFAVQPNPPGKAFLATPGTWSYSSSIKVKGIGLDANPDYVAYVSGLTLEVCQAINKTVANDAIGATPPASGTTVAAFASADMSAVAAVASQAVKCVAHSDSASHGYTLYAVMYES